MPLQVIDDPTIGNAFAQLGNTIAAGPQKQIEAAHVAEQIRASQENRARLQQEFDAKNQIADHQANMDRLSSAKLAAGVNWTPDQENELQNARLRFSQAATRASALGGEGTEKGIWGSQGQGRMLVEQPTAGTPAYTQVYTATHGSPPDPTKEQKTLANVQFTGPNGEIINRSTTDHKTDAQTGLPFSQIIPKDYNMLAAGSVTPTSPGGQFEAGPANASLLTATQQLQQNLPLTESPASLAAKYAHIFGTTNDIQRGPNGELNIVGLQKTAGNPAFQPLHDYLQREYYDKGGRLPAPAGAGAAAATPGATGAPAQPGGNVLGGAGAGNLFSPQSSVQTQAIPASQVSTQQLPGSQAAAAAAPNAPPGAPGAQTTAAPPYVWKPSAPAPLGGTQNVGGVANVTPITRGFDQQAASRVMQDPVMAAFHVSDRGYNELQRAAKYDNAYADLHMIYALAKIFDPISAVRGEELELGRTSGPWADRIKGMWNYVRDGGRLDARARSMILEQGYTSANTNFESAVNMLEGEQKKLMAQNLDPRAHLPEITQPQPADAREINRYGTGGYTPGSLGDPNSDKELIRIAGRVMGGIPGQASTSAAGAPPAAPQGAATKPSLRSGQNTAPAATAPAGAPKSSGNPLIDWADSQFRQGAR